MEDATTEANKVRKANMVSTVVCTTAIRVVKMMKDQRNPTIRNVKIHTRPGWISFHT